MPEYVVTGGKNERWLSSYYRTEAFFLPDRRMTDCKAAGQTGMSLADTLSLGEKRSGT